MQARRTASPEAAGLPTDDQVNRPIVDNEIAVKHRVYIDAPTERVFQTLTTAEGWCGWFTHRASIDRRPGGDLTFEWREFGPDRYTANDHGRVLEVVENQMFSFTWHPGATETIVTFKFETRGAGCLVDVEERGYRLAQPDVSTALQVASGWGEAMTLLKFFLERGAIYGSVPMPQASLPR